MDDLWELTRRAIYLRGSFHPLKVYCCCTYKSIVSTRTRKKYLAFSTIYIRREKKRTIEALN